MMREPSQFCAPFALAGLLCLSAPPAAFACGFHPSMEVELEGMYPGSFPVAVALRTAAESGVIDATALKAPSKGTGVYADTAGRLQELGKTLAASPASADLPASFSLGYVESQLWSRYSQSDGRVHADIHTDGPAEGEAVVLTGEPVLTQVLAGRLSVEHALADGMILIVGNESDKAAIRYALNAISADPKISRR